MDKQNCKETTVTSQTPETMQAGTYVINPVDETAMRQLLERCQDNALGITLRLAWLQGLTRDEICNLTWSDIDFKNKTITVNGREIPLDEDTKHCLNLRQEEHLWDSPYVVISQKFKKPYAPTALNRLVRDGLDSVGMEKVRIVDLRHDFVIRQTKEHGWVHAIKVAGLTVQTFQTIYAKLGIHKEVEVEQDKNPSYDAEFNMWRILQENKESAEGIGLWLRWQLDLQLLELVDLTWDDIDFATNEIHLPTRTVVMSSPVRIVLYNEKQRRSETDDPHVLLSPRSRTPMDTARLSRLMRSLLIRNGISEFPVRYLRGITTVRAEKDKILVLARSQRGIVAHDVLAALDITPPVAHRRLKELVEGGKLIKIRSTYYLPETTVPPERHEEEVVRYLSEQKAGSLDALADHLGLQNRQCNRILSELVDKGVLCKEGTRYVLPGNE